MATAASTNNAVWTPQLVEDLVARQFLHNQDVTALKPPAPLAARNLNQQTVASSSTGKVGSAIVPFSDATKQYMKFFNQGSNSSSNNQNMPPPSSVAMGGGGGSTTPAIMSPSAKAMQQQSNTASPRFGALNAAPTVAGFQSMPSSPQSKMQQQQPQQNVGMFPPPSSASVMPPSPSSHHQLQQLHQIQQQLSSMNGQQQQQQQQQPKSNAASPSHLQQQQQQQQATNANNNMNGNTLATMGGLGQQQQQQAARATDCVAACKHLATMKVHFPPHIPSNNTLMARPDPNDPKKSLCPSATLMMQRIAAQQHVDADLIFAQPPASEDFPLNKIFAAYPDALKVIANARGESGDWRSDTFTMQEEATYKKEMGYTVFGPYQARSNNFGGLM